MVVVVELLVVVVVILELMGHWLKSWWNTDSRAWRWWNTGGRADGRLDGGLPGRRMVAEGSLEGGLVDQWLESSWNTGSIS